MGSGLPIRPLGRWPSLPLSCSCRWSGDLWQEAVATIFSCDFGKAFSGVVRCQKTRYADSSSKYLARRGIRRRSRVNPLSSGPLRRETPSWEIARSGGGWAVEGSKRRRRRGVPEKVGHGEDPGGVFGAFSLLPSGLRGPSGVAKTQDAGLGARDRAKEGRVSLRRCGESGDQLVSERGTSLYFGSPRERITSRS